MRETVRMDRLARCQLCGMQAVIRSSKELPGAVQYKIGCIYKSCPHYVGESRVFFNPDVAEKFWASQAEAEKAHVTTKPANHKDWESFKESQEEAWPVITVEATSGAIFAKLASERYERGYRVIATGRGEKWWAIMVKDDRQVTFVPVGAM